MEDFYSINIMAPTQEEQQVPFTFNGVVDGHYRAIQEWVLAFLTRRGTRRDMPNYGTDFLSRVRKGMIRTQDDLETQFSVAADKAASDVAGSPGELYVTSAVLQDSGFVQEDAYIGMDVAFSLSDGTRTSAVLDVR